MGVGQTDNLSPTPKKELYKETGSPFTTVVIVKLLNDPET